MGARAEALAKRIEQGAAQLAAYTEKLSDAQWQTPINAERDGRPMNVVVHHVASVYPVEVQLAQAIGSGKDMSEVTWDVVKNMNAGHATENANVRWAPIPATSVPAATAAKAVRGPANMPISARVATRAMAKQACRTTAGLACGSEHRACQPTWAPLMRV